MSDAQFCLDRRKKERAAFVRVLKAVLPEGMGYRHEPRARTAGELAWLIASEERALIQLLDTGTIDWKEAPVPASMGEIVAAYERDAAAVDERLARIDAAGWNRPGKFLWEGTPVWEDTVGELMWGHLLDGIHHRGQLSTYLRPMGSKVPSIYGPSGDDAGQ